MISRIRKFTENNKIFIPFISICMALLVVLTAGAIGMDFKRNALDIKYNSALQAFNDANARMLNENMTAFEKILLASFEEPQLVKIAQNNSKYGIMINGESLAKNENTVYSERPTIAVLLSENYGKTSLNLLPRNIVEIGSIISLDKADSLIKVMYGEATLETKVYDYYYGKTLSYLVSGIKPGDIVTIEVAPEIAEKIGLTDNIIEIFYNKEFAEESGENAN